MIQRHFYKFSGCVGQIVVIVCCCVNKLSHGEMTSHLVQRPFLHNNFLPTIQCLHTMYQMYERFPSVFLPTIQCLHTMHQIYELFPSVFLPTIQCLHTMHQMYELFPSVLLPTIQCLHTMHGLPLFT